MSDNKGNIDYFELAVKYLADEADSEERQVLEKWIGMSDDNRKFFDSIQSTWNRVDIVDGLTPDIVQQEWERLETEIDSLDLPTSTQAKKRVFPIVIKIAAAIVLFIAASIVVYQFVAGTGEVRVITENDSKNINLEDGSQITLNAASSLTYPEKFNEKERKVTLRGEAYFDIERDESKPFIIHVKDARIKVLGTSFNVRAYEDAGYLEVVVQSGSVALYAIDTTIVLQAGDKGVYRKHDAAVYSQINDDPNYLAWKSRKLIFEDEPLQEVVSTLNRVYFADIRIRNVEILNCPLSTTFNNQSLDAVLRVIESTLDVQFEDQGNYIDLLGEGCN